MRGSWRRRAASCRGTGATGRRAGTGSPWSEPRDHRARCWGGPSGTGWALARSPTTDNGSRSASLGPCNWWRGRCRCECEPRPTRMSLGNPGKGNGVGPALDLADLGIEHGMPGSAPLQAALAAAGLTAKAKVAGVRRLRVLGGGLGLDCRGANAASLGCLSSVRKSGGDRRYQNLAQIAKRLVETCV